MPSAAVTACLSQLLPLLDEEVLLSSAEEEDLEQSIMAECQNSSLPVRTADFLIIFLREEKEIGLDDRKKVCWLQRASPGCMRDF